MHTSQVWSMIRGRARDVFEDVCFFISCRIVRGSRQREDTTGQQGGTERCDWGDDGSVKKGGRKESLPFERKFSG